MNGGGWKTQNQFCSPEDLFPFCLNIMDLFTIHLYELKENPAVNGNVIENYEEFILAKKIYSNLFKYLTSVNILNANKFTCDCED